MKKYYYADGAEKFGPFTLEELLSRDITNDTLVWARGMTEWKMAKDVPEVQAALNANPPPIDNPFETDLGMNKGSGECPKTWLPESILCTLFCCIPFGIVAIVHASRVDTRFRAGDSNGAEESSLEAGKWVKIAFWLGLIIGVIYIIAEINNPRHRRGW